MLIYRIITVFCLSLFLTETHAQVIVKGKIKDTSSKTLPYVTVRILQNDSTYMSGTSTDSIGGYKFVDVPQGSYLLAISSIGYISRIYPFTVKDEDEEVLPDMTLVEDNVRLGEVKVEGQSFIRKKDRVLIIPDKQQVKHAHTGYDLLYNLMIPNVDVDRRKGSVSTLGGECQSLYKWTKSGLSGSEKSAA